MKKIVSEEGDYNAVTTVIKGKNRTFPLIRIYFDTVYLRNTQFFQCQIYGVGRNFIRLGTNMYDFFERLANSR
jgi:hypothetical protein